MEIGDLYDNYKPLLFTLAYQMLGSSSEAEDVVQDVFVKLHHIENDDLENPKAYLCKMITNRCLDLLKSARNQREQYVGTWLPEPILTTTDDISDVIIQNDLLSYAILVLMEKLSPVERSIFILKEAYSFDYKTISGFVDKSEVNCRKIFSRAKEKLGAKQKDSTQYQVDKDWMGNLISAMEHGSLEVLMPLLSEEITLYSDGGGKVPAAIYPIHTPELVFRFLTGLLKRLPLFGEGVRFGKVSLNGEDGLVMYNHQEIFLVAMFELEDNLLKNIFFVRNPDKLKKLTNQLITLS
ncbi:RNA polymerase sigma factor SigJ [Ornithinibacillus sp. 179-J 7C1 HS]|uniref:RNA polymerase sigma factor SigJ n=1 Tax=Ornithinibacillus sp. 179-J 7C1 HS TaxID=3142384 RepID=UPI0039A35944